MVQCEEGEWRKFAECLEVHSVCHVVVLAKGGHKLYDRTASCLRPSISCEAKRLTIYDLELMRPASQALNINSIK